MKRLRIIVAAALAAALSVPAAPVPRAFEADVAHPGTYQTSAYRGETLAIEARFVEGRGRRPFAIPEGAEARMLVSTNGADWWEWPATAATGGVVRAAWTPEMDCGADAYRVFLAVSEGGTNVVYGANMLLRLLGSPGAEPNALPPPVRLIDFSAVAVTNAPWATTNELAAAIAGIDVAESDPLFKEWADSPGGTNGLVRADPYSGDISVEGDISTGSGIHAGGNVSGESVASDGDIHAEGSVTAGGAIYNDRLDTHVYPDAGGLYNARWYYIPPGENDGPGREISVKADTAAAAVESTNYTDSATAGLASRSWVLCTIGGTNTWMEVAGDVLGVYSRTDAASTNVIWESSAGIGASLAGVADRATNNTTRIEALEARPDLTSWGDYAPDGSPNPDPDAVLYLNKALTMMGSGFSWATSGSCACLCQSGAVAFQVETNGEIRIGTDIATNYFGLVQGGSFTVGCRTDGIRVEGGIAYLEYAYAGGEFPVVWVCGDLVEGVWQETAPVWTDNGDGTATAAVPVVGARSFYKATSTRLTGAFFRSNVPAHFPAGIYGSLAAEPVVYDSVITVTSGGRTYRVPAEEVR